MIKAKMKKTAGEKQRKARLWQLIVQELLLTGLVLCVFALFHHVIPRTTKALAPVERLVQTETGQGEYNETDAVETWQEKFAGQFSKELTISQDSYKSPQISITISRHSNTQQSPALTYYVADIYISRIENFKTAFPSSGNGAAAEDIVRENQAVLGINGDYALNQSQGFLVRNGLLYLSEQTTCDICVLYQDGTMATYGPDEYTVAQELEKKPYQVWKFGPELLESDGSPKSAFNISSALTGVHPRSGIGYYEPGHYCFVVVDGRQSGYSAGISMQGLAQIFSELGCVSAYNLDGGASSTMVFNGETINSPSGGGRYVGDMLLICEYEPQEDMAE